MALAQDVGAMVARANDHAGPFPLSGAVALGVAMVRNYGSAAEMTIRLVAGPQLAQMVRDCEPCAQPCPTCAAPAVTMDQLQQQYICPTHREWMMRSDGTMVRGP